MAQDIGLWLIGVRKDEKTEMPLPDVFEPIRRTHAEWVEFTRNVVRAALDYSTSRLPIGTTALPLKMLSQSFRGNR